MRISNVKKRIKNKNILKNEFEDIKFGIHCEANALSASSFKRNKLPTTDQLFDV